MATEQDKHAVKDIKGAFKRSATAFHDAITAESSQYTAEPNRYHLYYSAACPWCHRVLAVIALKGLEDVISASNVSPLVAGMGTKTYLGWRFNEEYPDPLHNNSKSIWDIYKIHDKDYPNKKLTVPIIFDKKTQTIVNNESAEIITFLNSEFNQFAKNSDMDLNPNNDEIQALMQQWNDLVYPGLNDGVYRCGFAKSQEAYDDAVTKVFDTLDKMEQQLAKTRYLCGDKLTLSDVRAWVSLVRFDAIYFTHFKCNLKTIRHDYPNIWGYTRDIYQMNGKCAGNTVDLKYSKLHYYGSHKAINPFGIVAKGPIISFEAPHNRNKVPEDEDEQKENLV
eukprot:143497_1